LYRYEHDIGEANKQRETIVLEARRCDKLVTLALREDKLDIDIGGDYCDSDLNDEDD
jgi:hypothetical protein